ncbi:DUF2182 domain-containing protein [Haladaptatus sp. NG-SE-30]
MHIVRTTQEFIFRRRYWGVVVATYLLALLAWVALVDRWLPMAGTHEGATAGTHTAMTMSAPGVPEAMALSSGLRGIALYLLLWGTMMVAMMFPSSAPAFQAYYRTIRDATTPVKIARMTVVMGTFVLVWALTGVVSLAVNLAFPIVSLGTASSVLLFGSALVLLAAYQLSPYKCRYLRHCRAPDSVVEGVHPGVSGALRSGWRFGVASIGCCWALMGLMVVVGSMNILWMAGITVVVSTELLAPNGERLAELVGVVSGVGGLAVLIIGAL